MLKFTFDNSQSDFFKTLKEKVDGYFADKQINPTGNGKIYFKGALQVATAILIYIVLVFR